MDSVSINYAFARHGYGCHNSLRSLYENKVISKELMKTYNNPQYYDPELTPIGVDASIHNGCIISKILKALPVESGMSLGEMHIVGCSPLIRSIETAYYMTRQWKNRPDKIYVLPHLREIDEGASDKYSKASRQRIDGTSSYAMKSIPEQKRYLESKGLLQYFDFSAVEVFEQERNEPGDIKQFMKWFAMYFVPMLHRVQTLNVFVITHAGVLRDFANEGFANNSGFVINTMYKQQKVKFGKFISLNNYLPSEFFTDYGQYADSEYYCPSQRCSFICTEKNAPSQNRKSVEFPDCSDT